VSEPSQPGRSQVGEPRGAEAPRATGRETEEIDALPVLAQQPTVVRAYPIPGALASGRRPPGAVIPAVQAAAAAAGGFVAGAAIVGLVARRQRRSSALSKGRRAGRELSRAGRGARASGRTGELVQIVGSRSLLVDVHLLGGRD
jgi:hypothetical protein